MLHRRTDAFHTRGFYNIVLVHPKDKHIFGTVHVPILGISTSAAVHSFVEGVLI